jgi:predicted MFS family arabinose efflux permease
VALGAPLAGLMIDSVGPWGGFVAVGAAAAVLSLICLAAQQVRRRRSA